MKHIIISDTHSPECIRIPYEYIKKNNLASDCDAIVINGDLLSIFAIDRSVPYKVKPLDNEELLRHLHESAPNFFFNFTWSRKVTPEMIIAYVQERYDWCYSVLEDFSKLGFTIFNMGNHESPLHFLVLHEIPFLTGLGQDLIQSVDNDSLVAIFNAFEARLYALEKQGSFKYIRDAHMIVGSTMILGIPGESHGTEGGDWASQEQEKKTQVLTQQALADISKVDTLIVYNHTQGRYNRDDGSYQTASVALQSFMNALPATVTDRVYVQSHNHWSYSQLIVSEDFTYLLNNAGLQEGIFNVLEFGGGVLQCYDVDPKRKNVYLLKSCSDIKPYTEERELIARYYDDVDSILKRRNGLL
jgi:hypothetical protein